MVNLVLARSRVGFVCARVTVRRWCLRSQRVVFPHSKAHTMGHNLETLSAVNSFLRTLLAMVVVGAVGVSLWFGYTTYNQNKLALQKKQDDLDAAQSMLNAQTEKMSRLQEELVEKDREIATLSREMERLETKMQLLKVDSRVAEISVLDQRKDQQSGELITKISFVELDDRNQPIDAAKEVEIQGDTMYVDYWVVKFKDAYVEQADLLRGTSICLLQRLFGNAQSPDEGIVLDKVGSRPHVYARGGKETDFEKEIWSQFWEIASDPIKSDQLAVRSAHGVAPYTKLSPGKKFRITLRASDGLSIVPVDQSGG